MDAMKRKSGSVFGRAAALRWALFAVWLVTSLIGLGVYEYAATIRGLMCIAAR